MAAEPTPFALPQDEPSGPPPPASVVTKPLVRLTDRMTLLFVSATKTLPRAPDVTDIGLRKRAFVPVPSSRPGEEPEE